MQKVILVIMGLLMVGCLTREYCASKVRNIYDHNEIRYVNSDHPWHEYYVVDGDKLITCNRVTGTGDLRFSYIKEVAKR
jgi:hypothetical protein